MTTCLNQNLQYILPNNKNLVEKLVKIDNLNSHFSFVYSQSGQAILVKDGVVLNDTSEPVNEAIEIFKNLPEHNENDMAIIIGFEVGYLFSYFANNFKGSIIIWEPCIENLRIIFEMIDYSTSFNRPNIFITTNTDEINNAIAKAYKRTGNFYIVANAHYYKENTELIKLFNEQLEVFQVKPYTGGPLKLNIGAGIWGVKDWRILDYYKEADFCTDLRKMEKIKIEDNMIEKAFSSHCIEHLSDEHIEHLFSEMHRCIKPNGIFRIGCPDADKAFNAYKENNTQWFNWLKESHIGEMLLNTFVSYESKSGGPKASAELVKEKFESLSKDEFINWAISLVDETRPYIAHRNAIYFEKLKKMLEKAGFKNIKRSYYQKSNDKELRGEDFDRYENISLFVECNK